MQSSAALAITSESASFRVVTTSQLPANSDVAEVVGEVPVADHGANIDGFVRANHGALFARAMWLTRDAADANDLLQDTFERALGATRKSIPQDRLKSWLLVIMHNLFLDRRRAAARRPSCALTDQIVDLVSRDRREPEEGTGWESYDYASVEAVLPRLPQALRTTFSLYAQGRAYAEIARELDIPAGTVATRIHRARHLLRDLIQAC